MSMLTHRQGMTLIEILIVIGIASLLLAFIATPLVSFYKQVAFRGAVEEVLTVLDEARKNTLSSYYSTNYGVHFEDDRIVLFRGGAYVDGAATNIESNIGHLVTITDITLTGGGDDVIFNRITGETAQSGAVTIQLNNSSTTATVLIHATGLAESN